jgi:hypothetical protein
MVVDGTLARSPHSGRADLAQPFASKQRESKMDELLTHVLNAHGGVDNWSKVQTVTAKVRLGGPFWGARGWSGVYDDQTVTLDAHREHITFSPFPGAGLTSVFDVDPEVVRIQAADGRVIERRERPEARSPRSPTKSDGTRRRSLTSRARRRGTTSRRRSCSPTPVEARGIEPWLEDGQTWRRLAVRFPRGNANHNPDQTFYDEDFLQRRMDYSPEVTGAPPVAHYTHDPKTLDGFVFYTRRLVRLHDADGVADQRFACITIDLDSVAVDRS